MSQPTPPESRRLLTVSDVAKRLQLSIASIYTMVAAGTLPALRVGNGRGSIRFRETDINDYLAGCAVRQPNTVPRREPVTRKARQELKHLKVGKREVRR